jgi:hypothetical protein
MNGIYYSTDGNKGTHVDVSSLLNKSRLRGASSILFLSMFWIYICFYIAQFRMYEKTGDNRKMQRFQI